MSKDKVQGTKRLGYKMKKIKKTKKRIISLLLTAATVFAVFVLPVAAENRLSELTAGDVVNVGGMPFGIKIYTDGVLVVGFSPVDCNEGSPTPASDAGLTVGDVIKEANGTKITSAAQFAVAVNACGGNLLIKYVRHGKEYAANITPSVSKKDGKMKTGMWLRDSTAGIGTVTFTVPETNEFAGLGHGVCDAETGELVSLTRGTAAEARISGVKRGTSGAPGELRGYFTGRDTGCITKNTPHGVFGKFDSEKSCTLFDGPICIASKSEVTTGSADIYSTLDGCEPSVYKIHILNLPKDGTNFEIEVCDASLLEKTGGIVQGMSGSPIIQNGKLVGAVTHVLISDPTKGYGIFIEDMLEAAG